MRFIFHGGAQEVGRSCIELQTKRSKILLDCGAKIDHFTEYPTDLENFSQIDAAFIGHAHLDHTGALPIFNFAGLNCPIFTTWETAELTKRLLEDSYEIEGKRFEHPAYNEANIQQVMGLMQYKQIGYDYDFQDIKYRFHDAGHIPGSVGIKLEVEGKKIFYTSDINTNATRVMNPADLNFGPVDILISESTYGYKEHPPREQTEKEFLQAIQEGLDKNGSILVPSFAVGRAQEMLLLLTENDFGVPIYIDGMANEITKLMLGMANIKDQKKLREAYGKARTIKGGRQRADAVKEQSIFISPAGMMDGGPVVDYLRYFWHDEDATILITGFQAPGSNGRNLLDSGIVSVEGQRRQVKCSYKQFDFSAHAGKSGLIQIMKAAKPKAIILVHGEHDSIDNLSKEAKKITDIVLTPELGEIIEI